MNVLGCQTSVSTEGDLGDFCTRNQPTNREKFESEHVRYDLFRTRKMVNYASEGQSQGRL